MQSSNYFKSSDGNVIFFVDAIPESVETAWEAVENDAGASVYQPVRVSGPWDRCPIIGHRPRHQILQDLSLETDPVELENLHDELTSLQSCYANVGRAVPLTAIAA